MFWVVQNNIFRENNHLTLIDTLKEMKIPFAEVKVVPFFDLLLPSDFDSHHHKGEIGKENEAYINETGLVMVSGGIPLTKIAKARGWQPGSFLNDNFHYKNWLSAYGKNLLNSESIVGTFREINPMWDEFFIRPCEDTKDFNGTVYTKDEFEKWREELLRVEGVCQFSDSQVVASPAKHVEAEYRLFIVDGRVVAYSQYKRNFKIVSYPKVEEDVLTFTQIMVDTWQPARAFVIDIARTAEGLKVIEINNINSAGFYSANIRNIVEAIENLKF